LEIQVVDIADEIAYDNHDLDDGLKSGLIKESDLDSITIWQDAVSYVESNYKPCDNKIKRSQVIRYLINLHVSDLLKNSLHMIEKHGIKDIKDLEKIQDKTVCFSRDMNEKRAHLKKFLIEKLYKHYRVVRMSKKATRFMRSLFEIYCDNPEQLPPNTQETVKEIGKYRAIADYIAGMTDRYFLDQYKKFFEPYERV
jgi:dGTPase